MLSTTAQHTQKKRKRNTQADPRRPTCLSVIWCGAQPNLRKAVFLTASSDVTHIKFPAFLKHTDGYLMFKGATMTTNQTAMQQNTVLLC